MADEVDKTEEIRKALTALGDAARNYVAQILLDAAGVIINGPEKKEKKDEPGRSGD